MGTYRKKHACHRESSQEVLSFPIGSIHGRSVQEWASFPQLPFNGLRHPTQTSEGKFISALLGRLQSGQIAQRGSNSCHRESVNTMCPCRVCPFCGRSTSAMSRLGHRPEDTLLTSLSGETEANLPEAIGQWLNSTAVLIGSLGADFSCLAYLYLFKSNLLQSILIL